MDWRLYLNCTDGEFDVGDTVRGGTSGNEAKIIDVVANRLLVRMSCTNSRWIDCETIVSAGQVGGSGVLSLSNSSVVPCVPKGFCRGDTIIISSGAEGNEFRVKKVRSDTVKFGKIRWYHRIKPIVRSFISMCYWLGKCQLKRWRVKRLSRGDL